MLDQAEEEANNDTVLQLRLSVRPNYKTRKPSAVSGQTSHIGQHSKVFNSLTLRPGTTKQIGKRASAHVAIIATNQRLMGTNS